jgi:transcriptional regulator with XRE-family HTH domain
MDIGYALKSIRKQLSISQQDLADKCSISQTSISQIENGLKQPTRKTIEKICMVLDIPEAVVYIVAIEDNDVSPSKKEMYHLLYPSIKSLALGLVC